MAKHTDHEQIAELLREHSPDWLILEVRSDRGPVSALASNWNSERRPHAFRGQGYVFRSRKTAGEGLGDDRPRFLLEGRYIGNGPAPY